MKEQEAAKHDDKEEEVAKHDGKEEEEEEDPNPRPVKKHKGFIQSAPAAPVSEKASKSVGRKPHKQAHTPDNIQKQVTTFETKKDTNLCKFSVLFQQGYQNTVFCFRASSLSSSPTELYRTIQTEYSLPFSIVTNSSCYAGHSQQGVLQHHAR